MKKEKINPTTKAEKADLRVNEFSELFPEGTLAEIQESEIPEAVMEIFERKSAQFINKDKYQPRNFEVYFVINHTSGDRTYLAQQTKTYETNKDTERLVYFVDARDDRILGYSELRNNISNPSEYFKDKPFVGYTETEKEFRNHGLGTRRLLLMNAFSLTQYGRPLNSDTLNSEMSLWENLVKRGLAKKFQKSKNIRYSFIATTETPQT